MKLDFGEKVLILLALEEKAEDCKRNFSKSISEEHKTFWSGRAAEYEKTYSKVLAEERVDPE